MHKVEEEPSVPLLEVWAKQREVLSHYDAVNKAVTNNNACPRPLAWCTKYTYTSTVKHVMAATFKTTLPKPEHACHLLVHEP